MVVSCRKCKFFYVTWDPKSPYGCKAFNFKSKLMPSMEVFKSSGRSCLKFEEKKK